MESQPKITEVRSLGWIRLWRYGAGVRGYFNHVVLGFCALSSGLLWASDVSVEGRVTRAELLRGHLAYRVTLRWTNSSSQRLNQVPLEIYNKRYEASLPRINDLNHRQIYPGAISTSETHFETCHAQGEPCRLGQDPKSPTRVWVMLGKALEPGQSLEIQTDVKLRIPRKFGSYGVYQDQLTLSAGWLPHIPRMLETGAFAQELTPPSADYHFRLKTEVSMMLGGMSFTPEILSQGVHLRQRRSPSLKVFLGAHDTNCQVHGRLQTCFTYEQRVLKNDIKRMGQLSAHWMNFMSRHPMLQKYAADVQLIQAPLREVLVRNSEGASYVSDRAFRLAEMLQTFHLTPLVHAHFYQWAYPLVAFKEPDEHVELFVDALAAYWTDAYLQDMAFHNRDARKLKAVRWFSFLPMIDIMLYSPQFAFADVFYDSLYPFDSNRDDFWRYQHRRVPGRTFVERLKDRVGLATVDAVMQAYTDSDQPMLALLTKHQANLDEEALRSFATYPTPRDYRIERVKSLKAAKKTYQITFSQEPAPIEISEAEPVEILVRDKAGNTQALVWQDTKQTHEVTLTMPKKLASVEVDPRFRLLDQDRSNNRTPAKYKTVLSELFLNYDFNQQQPEVFLLGQYRRVYGGQNRYSYRLSYLGDAYGGGVGLIHLFGSRVDSLRMSHALSLSFGIDHLTADTAAVQTTSGPALLNVSPSGFATTVSGGYFFGNQLSFINPMRGFSGGISGSLSSQMLGGDFDYYRVGVGGTYVAPLHPLHLLAFRASLDRVGGSNVPTPAYLRLGGSFNLRGLSLFDDRYRGKNSFLLSAEYRHFWVTDLDVNTGYFRLRDIQGALFTDLGSVSDTLEDRVFELAGLQGPQDRWRDLFDPRRFQNDVGYGLRFFIDYFGVANQLWAFDVAYSTTSPEAIPRFYFRVTQSF